MPALDGNYPPWMMLLILWELVWKGIALWRAGRDDQLYWFLAIFIINSAGILPIVYLLFFSRTRLFKTTQRS